MIVGPIVLAQLFAGFLLVSGCAPEPESRIVRSSADDVFTLTLEAPVNHVLPEDSIPIRVQLEYGGPPLVDSLAVDIDLVANNGQLDIQRLSAVFPGGGTVDNRFTGWVVFTAFRGITSKHQGEVHALAGEIQARLKIRIESPPEDILIVE